MKLFVSQFALLYIKCTVYFSIILFMINFSLFLSCLIDGYTDSKLLSYCKMFNYMTMCIVLCVYVVCDQIVFIINAM